MMYARLIVINLNKASVVITVLLRINRRRLIPDMRWNLTVNCIRYQFGNRL